MLISDLEIRLVAKTLLQEIKREARTEAYPHFLPDSIMIIGGKVRFKRAGGTTNLQDCLHRLGVTIYHLAAGESELTKQSYQIDGYKKPLDSCLWPAINHCLSGKACSLDGVEIAFGVKFSFRKALANLLSPIKACSLAMTGKLARVRQNLNDFSQQQIDKIKSSCSSSVFRKTAAICMLLLGFATIGLYWYFNWHFSVGAVVIISSLVSGVVFIFNTFDLSDGEREAIFFDYGWRNVIIAFITIGLLIGGSFSCAFRNASVNDMAVIDRKTDEIKGFLHKNPKECYLNYNGYFINHLKYRIAQIPICSGIDKYDVKIDKPIGITGKIRVAYAVAQGAKATTILQNTDRDKLAKQLIEAAAANVKLEEVASPQISSFIASLPDFSANSRISALDLYNGTANKKLEAAQKEVMGKINSRATVIVDETLKKQIITPKVDGFSITVSIE